MTHSREHVIQSGNLYNQSNAQVRHMAEARHRYLCIQDTYRRACFAFRPSAHASIGILDTKKNYNTALKKIRGTSLIPAKASRPES